MTSKFVQTTIDTYKEINFVSQVEKIFRFKDFENRLKSFKKDEILSIFQGVGYQFVMKKPGKEFTYRESVGPVEFVVSFNINGGVILPYLYIYIDGEKVPYEYPSFVFTYKFLISDMDSLMNPSTVYTNYSDFKTMVTEFLNIYEKFKDTFLKKIAVV